MKRILVFSVLAILVFVACQDLPTAGHPEGPQLTIWDGSSGGSEHFFFLPPIVKGAGPFGGVFDGSLTPEVQIAESGTLLTNLPVSVDLASEQYQALWHTKDFDLDATKSYRINVIVASQIVMYADIDAVDSGRELKNARTGEVIALKDGTTLPINFFVEVGFVAQIATNVDVIPKSHKLSPVGDLVQLTATATDENDDVILNKLFTWSSSDESVATVSTSGLVTAVGIGTATITATADDVSGTAAVTVSPTLEASDFCSDYPDAAIPTFEDPNLEAAVKTALEIGAQANLTCGLVSGLTQLNAQDAQITSLVGSQNLTGLSSLFLTNNSITDIIVLSGLTNLRYLFLGGNSITDISVLSGLTGLMRLDLYDNPITDISVLSGLTNLTTLVLYDNPITDFSVLSGLTNLERIDIGNNSITDISMLSGLTGLSILHLYGNLISDISALSELTGLSVLHLRGNLISDISALSNLTNLWNLNLNSNPITDISALSGLTNLSELNLANNPNLTDIQPLLGNTGLGVGDLVLLENTGVSCIDVAALRAKGVAVWSDCP